MQIDYPIETLPAWIISSRQFKEFKEMYPEEITFPCLDIYMNNAISIEINSYDDIDRIIGADFNFGYSEETNIQIFANVDKFYNENPNSAPVRLPNKNNTWLGMQIRELLETNERALIMNCMKLNYVELFKWKVQSNETAIADAQNYCSVFSLLYYAVVNNNIEILQAGIDAGCSVKTAHLLTTSFENQCLESTKIILSANKLFIVSSTLEELAAKGSLEQLIYVIEWIKREKPTQEIKFNLTYALRNPKNLTYLFENNYFEIENPLNTLLHSILLGLPLENIQTFERLTGARVRDLSNENLDNIARKNTDVYDILFNATIKKNNIELYNYLRENGFKVTATTVAYAKNERQTNFSVGLINHHYQIDNM